jgi:hypothetical protein
MDKKVLITMKDINRYKILSDLIDKRIKGDDAAILLNLSYVHVSRLKKKFSTGGFEAILRKLPEVSPNKKISEKEINEIIKLRKNIYYDFNICHFTDKLHEVHNIPYSYASIKQILIKEGLYIPRKKKIIHRQRRRMPKSGMLVQMDSSFHNWLPHIKEKWWLIAIIDDADNEVPYAKFFPKDTLFNNMHVLRRFIEIKGIFMSLYVDKASHFKTTRHGGLHYNVLTECEETQIERALSELGINLIPANSAQAKGRIEVTFRLFQDRLIKEMRLANIKTYDEASKFLIKVFLPSYNKKFSHPVEESTYMPIPVNKDLDLIFCIKKERTVNNDNTISFLGQIIQIPPSNIKLSFTKSKVEVCLLEDNRIFVLYKNKIIAESNLSKNNKVFKKEKLIEKLLNMRDYVLEPKHKVKRKIYKPAVNHPWRRYASTKKIKIEEVSNHYQGSNNALKGQPEGNFKINLEDREVKSNLTANLAKNG